MDKELEQFYLDDFLKYGNFLMKPFTKMMAKHYINCKKQGKNKTANFIDLCHFLICFFVTLLLSISGGLIFLYTAGNHPWTVLLGALWLGVLFFLNKIYSLYLEEWK